MEGQILTILLVEDDRFYKTYAMQTFKGHNNIYAPGVREAIQKFTANKPDITFIDINLNDGNGLELLREIKKINPDAFVVMMTGSNSRSDVKMAKEQGASGYILKPFNIKKVQECIEKFRALKRLNDKEKNN